MKLSQIISFLKEELVRVGDVEVYMEDNDGHSTDSVPFTLSPLVFRKMWDGHPAPRRYYFGG